MKRFEYLVVYAENDRVLTANGHWQGEVERGGDGDIESCPQLFEYLAEAGAQGWDLVALDPEERGTVRLYFKRGHGV
ncbi:MAG: hypothetical protein EA397_05775 [Deltaproteobacteria bacterium]|nr:MAG: hypothetical protein EA397_05775 [Deltaproteobacteria bacterium]